MISKAITIFITRIKRVKDKKGYVFYGDGRGIAEISRGETTRECLEEYGKFLKEQLDILEELT